MSKFKLVATETLPSELLEYLDSTDFAEMILARVLGRYMGIDKPWEKPAEHFVQQLDPAVEVNNKSVSYTHLDVYKRQRHDRHLWPWHLAHE